ncbi:McrB family protein [Algoriphagus sanaruensis]|uniref:AAA+ ATPase domain-containing protein n=1 Tax=Algoriphagus sanaruensis TaxID=1727163 RepID=A0A142EPM8_9BACT|nr:AAA family ATPase [Algoriphagus sanaruensis]AMQ57083.1 hypothetical protein AO498_11600 [Algoriphagus sanaruensis]
MTKQEIDQVIQEEFFQGIIQEKDFYFSKGREALQRWLDLQVSDQLKEDLIRLSADYTQFQEIAEVDPEIGKIMEMLLEITSYLDSHAKDKIKYNQYPDKRTVARASVRMGNWIDGLVKLKFKNAEITGPSISNAFNYILLPEENSPLLSESMREAVTKNLFKHPYRPEDFISDLKEYFDKFNLSVENPENYTFLVSNFLYKFYHEWGEQVIGLMASDGTGWHEGELTLDTKYSGLITWNSKKPSGGAETLKFLRGIINNGETFPLYVSSKNQVRYRIDVKDFVTSQKELDNAGWEKENIKYYKKNFSDFKDDNKSAYIVFLAESISKIEPKPIDDFIFYRSYLKPTQDNLSPIKQILGDETELSPSAPQSDNSETSPSPLNQIFFGPPGTGKTYHTINEALRILGVDVQDKPREQLKEEFDKRVAAGQIVFTTFHQSMNYEEFIEGIKPKISEGEDDEQKIDYQIEPGIFKKLSIEASFDLAKSQMSKETEETLDFSNLYDTFIEQVEEKLLNDESIEIKTKSGGTVLIDRISPQGNIIVKHPKGTREYIVSKARLTKLNNAFDNLDAVSNINDEFRGVIGGSNSSAYWSVLNAIKQINKKVKVKIQEKAYSFADKVEVVKKLTKEEFQSSTGKNFVLIIDEINRGNVSQIFGELITLIEQDKRLGKDEELKVTLPYSNDKFGVPSNLYIIGTMNTADRSVEALDTALRRRFSFREMPPIPELLEPTLMLQRLWLKYADLDWDDPRWISVEADFLELHKAKINNRKAYESLEHENDFSLLPIRFKELIQFEGINLEVLLKTINRRIEKLLDRDHLIGHSYLIQAYSWAELEKSFYQNIIPLLQEYFYGDYAKIGAILGEGFVRKQDDNLIEFASGFEAEIDNERVIYQIIDYREGYPGNQYKQPDMTFQKAILRLMNLPIA